MTFIVVDLHPQTRLLQLKPGNNEGGLAYWAEILGINRKLFGRSSRLDCAYVNEKGERVLFKTRRHMLRRGDNAENLQVAVYVNRFEPHKFEVEIFRKG
ncbi:MAG: hypothetical protein LBE35_04540 [Clostridiales bacterium]|jgi:hypothetical protein|nr:hypothetical protein [Clostridiales bacterium]